jgi:hypothetical protein
MKTQKLGIVQQLAARYGRRLARAQQELKEDEKRMRRQCSYVSDLLLFWKWAYRVGKGWHGFNLGHIPPVWTNMLDDFLAWLETQCPDFEIHQIKSKLGSIRIYIDTKSADEAVNANVRSEIEKLRDLLRTPKYLRYVRTLRSSQLAHKKVGQASSLSNERIARAAQIKSNQTP